MENLKQVVLSLGSNLGNKKNNLILALELLKDLPLKILKISNIYETFPHGFKSPNLFLNLAILGKTFLSPWALLLEIKKIEARLGRKIIHKGKYEDRPIDIDIIFYENMVINSNHLKIPHPLAHKRAFVMLPLLEIIPYFIHPLFNKTLLEIYIENKNLENLENLEILNILEFVESV